MVINCFAHTSEEKGVGNDRQEIPTSGHLARGMIEDNVRGPISWGPMHVKNFGSQGPSLHTRRRVTKRPRRGGGKHPGKACNHVDLLKNMKDLRKNLGFNQNLSCLRTNKQKTNLCTGAATQREAAHW